MRGDAWKLRLKRKSKARSDSAHDHPHAMCGAASEWCNQLATFTSHGGRTPTIRSSWRNCNDGQMWFGTAFVRRCLEAKGIVSSVGSRRFLRFVAVNYQLVADLGPAAEDGVRGQLQNALRFGIRHCDPEGAHQLAKSHHLEVLVHKDEIEREHHSDGVYGVGGHDPSPAIWWERPFAQQAGQPAPNRVFDFDPKGQEGLLRLVVNENVPLLSEHSALPRGVRS